MIYRTRIIGQMSSCRPLEGILKAPHSAKKIEGPNARRNRKGNSRFGRVYQPIKHSELKILIPDSGQSVLVTVCNNWVMCGRRKSADVALDFGGQLGQV